MLEAMARIARRQPNEAMARIAPRLVPQPNGKQQKNSGPQLDSFGVDPRSETARSSSAFNFCALAVPGTLDCATTTSHHHAVTGSHTFTFSLAAVSAGSPCIAAAFEVN
jgi:hypothetical protein